MKILTQKWLMQLREEGGDGGEPGGGGAPEPAAITLEAMLGTVDEGLRNEFSEVMKDVKDIPGLLKTSVSAQRMMGNSIRIPSEDALDEVKSKFYERLKSVPGVAITTDTDSLNASLGVPDSAEGYKVDLSALPEEVQISQAELDAKRAEWHALGLTPAQAEKAAQAWMAAEQKGYEDYMAGVNASEKALREKYGAAYDDKMALVQFVAKNAIEADDLDYLKATGALNRPGVVDMLVKLGEQLQDNGTIEAARRQSMTLAPEEAKERIAELKAGEAYFDKNHPDHKRVVQQVQSLYQQAHP